MSTELIVSIVIGWLILSLGFYLFSIVYASYCIYTQTLKRRSKEQWGRTPVLEHEPSKQMDREGLAWQAQYSAFKQDLHIVNQGLNLYGEYYDLGSDRAVMILSGRTDSLRYGYYFAKPYADSGFNVLVIDSRAHGLSDGEYNTLGFEESKDNIAWVNFLAKEYGIKTVVFHGICIGAAGGMFAITSPDCPSCVKGMVTEGMFINFGESMKNHLIERKKLWFPVMQCIDHWCKKYTGHSMMKGPIDVIAGMKKPLLMLQSKADPYSTWENAIKLYDHCPSQDKKLVLYEKGGHSLLRVTDTEAYDSEISAFLQKLIAVSEKQTV